MLCENCKTRPATVHLTEIIKDVKSELHLCETCAKEMGFNSQGESFSFSLQDVLSFLKIDGELKEEENKVLTCSFCGNNTKIYNDTQSLGCPYCYSYLEPEITTLIEGIQSNLQHFGKKPTGYKAPISIEEKNAETEKHLEDERSITNLKKMLEEAVLHEEYEEAAKLRDRITDLEGNR